MVGFYRKQYGPDSMILTIAGDISAAEARAAVEKAGYEADGIEVSPHAAEQARKRIRGQVAQQGAEEPFPFPEGRFDAVTLLDVIEHLPDYRTALANCRRCLRPGGKLFVITLNAHSLARPLLGKRWAWHQDPTHVHMFSARMLREGLEGAGLEVEVGADPGLPAVRPGAGPADEGEPAERQGRHHREVSRRADRAQDGREAAGGAGLGLHGVEFRPAATMGKDHHQLLLARLV